MLHEHFETRPYLASRLFVGKPFCKSAAITGALSRPTASAGTTLEPLSLSPSTAAIIRT